MRGVFEIAEEMIDKIPNSLQLRATDMYALMDEVKKGNPFWALMAAHAAGFYSGSLHEKNKERENRKYAYNLSDVEGILGVTHRTLLAWVKEGKLPAAKIGGRWKLSEDDLNSFLEQNRTELAGPQDRAGIEADDQEAGDE